MSEISLQEYVEELEGAVEQGQFETVVAHCRYILQHYPKHLAAYRLLGKAMLEAGKDRLAEDMFRRVLSGDPEDFVARVGMSIVADRQGDLQRAVWHMERAFELNPNNEAVQEELRRLYGRRDGVEPPKLHLTRAGLGRLYLRGNLLSRAIEEFQVLLAEDPERTDLWVALAEALWRNDQRVKAEEACLYVLDSMPYCLKANLLLGEMWTRSGRDEGRTYLQRATALDPENQLAKELFGDASPLEPRQVRLPRLEYVPPATLEERPAWLAAVGVGAQPTPGEEWAADLGVTEEARIEIPSWLEEVAAGEGPLVEEGGPIAEEGVALPDWLLAETAEQQMAEGVPTEAPAPKEAEIPEWLRGIGEAAPETEAPEAGPAREEPVSAEALRWLEEMGPSEAPAPEEVPEWLREVAPLEEKTAPPETPTPAEIPEWLRELAPPGVLERPEAEPGPPVEPVEEEIPEWLREGVEAAPEVPEGEVPAEPFPSWLEGEGMPSGDEALAWLESLTAGKEEELKAAAAAEAEARMAEIMGRPREEAAPPPPAELEPAAPAEAAEAPLPEEGFGWVRFEEAEEPAEAAPPEWSLPVAPQPPEMPLEEAEAPEMPEWLVSAAAPEVPPVPEEIAESPWAPPPEGVTPPEVPRAEVPPAEPEAFGWTTFGAEEVVREPRPVAPEEVEPVAEGFGWTGFEAEAVVPPEEAPAPEIWPEEVVAPERMPAPPPPPAVEELPVEEVVTLPEEVESLQQYLRAHPRDHQARLALARRLWEEGLYPDSLEAYSRLVKSGKQMEEVQGDMERYLRERPSDPVVRRVLGDTYMRMGRLEEALGVYREALEEL